MEGRDDERAKLKEKGRARERMKEKKREKEKSVIFFLHLRICGKRRFPLCCHEGRFSEHLLTQKIFLSPDHAVDSWSCDEHSAQAQKSKSHRDMPHVGDRFHDNLDAIPSCSAYSTNSH